MTTVRPRSPGGDTLRRFARNPTGMVGLAIVVAFVLVSVLAPLLRPFDPLRGDLRLRNIPPTWTLPAEELEARGLQRGSSRSAPTPRAATWSRASCTADASRCGWGSSR